MGFRCPVCEVVQADRGGLANHLAFMAMLGRDDHEQWLDEYAPDWNEEGPDELGPRIGPHVEAVDVEFDDSGHDAPDQFADDLARTGGYGRTGGAETRAVLEEARAMTRELLDAENEDADESE